MKPEPTPGPDWVSMHATPIDGVTLMRAHFVDHAFERHSHETYSLGVTHAGVQAFRCRGSEMASVAGNIIAFNPDEVHDGHAENESGFGYTMLYIDPDVVTQWMDEATGRRIEHHFRQPLVHDPQSAAALSRAMDALSQAQEALRAHALLSEAVIGFNQRHAFEAAGSGMVKQPAWIGRARDFMEAHFEQDLKVDALAAVAGVSRVHLTRAFSARYGAPPHVVLNAARLRHARRLLLAGEALAEVALASGFADQSHFTRRFKGSFGITPAAWLRDVHR